MTGLTAGVLLARVIAWEPVRKFRRVPVNLQCLCQEREVLACGGYDRAAVPRHKAFRRGMQRPAGEPRARLVGNLMGRLT